MKQIRLKLYLDVLHLRLELYVLDTSIEWNIEGTT